MNELMRFDYKNKEIRTINIGGVNWWVLKDVCEVLELSNTTMIANRLDKDEVTKFNLGSLSGETNIINESGLYSVILKSNKPEAKKFKKWITNEVLPQIRKTGGYIPIEEDDTNEIILAKAVLIADKTIIEKNKIIASQKERIEVLEETEKDWNLLMNTEGTFSINDVAHSIGIGEYKLFGILRDLSVLFKNSNGDNIPYEKFSNRGKFKACPAISPDGRVHLQTRVFPKGIEYIIRLLRKDGYLENVA